MVFVRELWHEAAAEFFDSRSSLIEASRYPKFVSTKLFNLPVLLNLASKTDQKWPMLVQSPPNSCEKMSDFKANFSKTDWRC